MKIATKPRRPLPTIRVSDLPKSDLLPPAGRRLMAKALTAMVRYPETVDMAEWYYHDDSITPSKQRPTPYCGTVACLAGHIMIAAEKLGDTEDGGFSVPAARELGLQEEDYDARHKLFLPSGKEGPWQPYFNATTPRGRARAVVARVKHWLRTGE